MLDTLSYMLNHWEKLTLFLREPGAPLDNNVCERAFTPNRLPPTKKQVCTLAGRTLEALVKYLRRSGANRSPVKSLINFVLVDSRSGVDFKEGELNEVRALGVEVLDLPLVTPESSPYLDEEHVISVLLSLV